MNRERIIDEYGARGVTVEKDMLPWMRSNHAGETGAVWIYRGARCAFWNQRINTMAAEHGRNEQRHLAVMDHLVAKQHRSRLLFIWRISGFTLGLLPSLLGYRAFCITIDAVETFVEQHYLEQIRYLEKHRLNPGLRDVLQRCCDEEVAHQQDAETRHGVQVTSALHRAWRSVVGQGSQTAVRLAKRI